MTSHERRAHAVEAMIGVHLQTASHPEVVKLLRAEFAAVEDATIGKCINDAQELERVLTKRVAVLEAALKDAADALAEAFERIPYCPKGNAVSGECSGCSMPSVHRWFSGGTALSGEPTALLALLERAVEAGEVNACDYKHLTEQEVADIAKRVWEGR